MTVQDLLTLASAYQGQILLGAVLVPLAAFAMNAPLGRGGGNRAPWSYLNSAFVYAVCLPGTAALVLTGYQLLFRRQNLLALPVAIYYAPILCMLATLAAVGRSAEFGPLPGFGRLEGLMALCGGIFALLLALDRLRILVIFGGSIATLVALFAFLFALLKWGARMFARRGDEPRPAAPELPLDELKGGGLFR